MTAAEPEKRIPSLLLHILFSEIDDTLGHRSLIRFLRRTGLGEFDEQFPPLDSTPSIPVEAWSTLLAEVYRTFGREAARSVFLQSGRLAAAEIRSQRVPRSAITGTALRLLPLDRRIRLVLEAFAEQSEETFGTPHYLYQGPEGYEVEIPDCPHCAQINRHLSGEEPSLDRPFCDIAAATLAETMEWALGYKCLVEEVACIATGQETCRFRLIL